ncbi:hypothetical protein LIER_40688 [Lithospermum erythrorhizon]|uniref:Uncharacterized protein n=1 Tax=Lithospermum erythrorhizon TaxID=34254 RepID=A0AAV3QY81_LITER
MEEVNLLIPQINVQTEKWIAQGNEMLAIAFSSAIPPISNTLKAFEVFKITNADIQESSKKYRVIRNNDLQWVLRRSTLIRHMPFETPNLSTLARDMVPFGKLTEILPNQGEKKAEDISLDILGVVIRADNQKSANSLYGPGTVQRFTFVDMEYNCYIKKSVPVTLWDELVKVAGPLLEEAVTSYFVVLARRLVVAVDVFDGTGRVIAGAIEFVVEQILKTTTAQLSQLLKLGVKYNLDPIRAELENKKFLDLLRRTYSRKLGGARRLLLVAFFDDMEPSDDGSLGIDPDTFPGSASIVGESSIFLSSAIIDLSSTPEKSTGKSFPISPLKRQMDNVTICPGEPLILSDISKILLVVLVIGSC